MKSPLTVCTLFVLCHIWQHYSFAEDADDQCYCHVKSECDPVTKWSVDSKEVVIMTDHTTDYEKWVWDSITAVVSVNEPNQDLMCFAHSKGAKYGIKRDIVADYDYTSENVTTFISNTNKILSLTNADILVLDLMPLIGSCNNAKEHVDHIINTTQTVITGIKQQAKSKNNRILPVICVVPWKPPCYDSECFVGPALSRVCDAIEVNPDSFITYCNDACIARATVPINRMRMGLIEYEASGFRANQILIGMPWHGYNYTCEKTVTANHENGRPVCYLKTLPEGSTNTSSKGRCLYESSRERIPIEEFYKDHPAALVLSNNNFDEVDGAPYTVTQANVQEGNQTVTKTYMGWFENIASLHNKYELVHDLGFRGVVVYNGDDLTYTNVQGEKDSLDDRMWAWVFHTILSTGNVTFQDDEPDYAAIVAGVGVSMFVFGCLLGVIFACVFFRRNKKLKAPFHRDSADTDEYHDEDGQL